MIPKRAGHLPALAVVRRSEEAAGQRPAPDDARLIGVACGERPDAGGAPVDRAPPHILFFVALGLRRIDRHCDLLPAVSVRTMELDAEMSEIERRVMPAVPRIRDRQRDVVAKEIDRADVPSA